MGFWDKFKAKTTEKAYHIQLRLEWRRDRTRFKERVDAVAHGNGVLWITFDDERKTETYHIGSMNGETGEPLDDISVVNMWFCLTLHIVKNSLSPLYKGALAYALEVAAQLITQPELLFMADTAKTKEPPAKEGASEDEIERIKLDHDITKN